MRKGHDKVMVDAVMITRGNVAVMLKSWCLALIRAWISSGKNHVLQGVPTPYSSYAPVSNRYHLWLQSLTRTTSFSASLRCRCVCLCLSSMVGWLVVSSIMPTYSVRLVGRASLRGMMAPPSGSRATTDRVYEMLVCPCSIAHRSGTTTTTTT